MSRNIREIRASGVMSRDNMKGLEYATLTLDGLYEEILAH